MKRTKKIILSVVLSILIIGAGIFGYYKFFYDNNALSLNEKEWISQQKNAVISFNVPNNLNVFSVSGKGVFYDFLEKFERDNEINLNKNVVNNSSEFGFVVNDSIGKDDLLIFKDHYAVIAKELKDIKTVSDLSGQTIGISSDFANRIASYKLNTTSFENRNDLLTALKDDKVTYIVVPLNEYIDSILENNYKIVYHFDEFIKYYYIHFGRDATLNNIIHKFYNNWIKNNYEESYYSNLSELFIDKLKISQVDMDKLTSKTYTYGFVNSTPYETLSSGKYGGKIFNYLESFNKLSNVDFVFNKFNDYGDLKKAFDKQKINMLFDNMSFDLGGNSVKTNIKDNYYIIGPLSNAYKVSVISDLSNVDVYVIRDSKLARELAEYKNISIKTVRNLKDLIKATRKQKIVAIDKETFDYLKNTKINNYQVIYSGYSSNYVFKYQNIDDTFNKLFSNYVMFISDYDMSNMGALSYSKAESNGNLISLIAKYILTTIALIIVVMGLVIVKKKNVKLNTKIKKDEKLKFVDMLTSLKNRNYLNERINVWNQNTIYPQAVIVVDLNNIKYLNDTFGSKEGDRQIMAAANILHQTQLDNTEIMRTDGNEFMIYLVGYNEKQVVNYLKKLVKEFKELPYEYGAAFGFSMIVDDLKLIDDAINEATIQMRENKDLENEKNEGEN